MQQNTISLTVGSTPLEYRRYSEGPDATTYIVSGEHSPLTPSTLVLKRALSAPNRGTGFPGNKRPSFAIRLTSKHTATAGEGSNLIQSADAMVEVKFLIPNWDDDLTRLALVDRAKALLGNTSVIGPLTTILEI